MLINFFSLRSDPQNYFWYVLLIGPPRLALGKVSVFYSTRRMLLLLLLLLLLPAGEDTVQPLPSASRCDPDICTHCTCTPACCPSADGSFAASLPALLPHHQVALPHVAPVAASLPYGALPAVHLSLIHI